MRDPEMFYRAVLVGAVVFCGLVSVGVFVSIALNLYRW